MRLTMNVIPRRGGNYGVNGGRDKKIQRCTKTFIPVFFCQQLNGLSKKEALHTVAALAKVCLEMQ